MRRHLSCPCASAPCGWRWVWRRCCGRWARRSRAAGYCPADVSRLAAAAALLRVCLLLEAVGELFAELGNLRRDYELAVWLAPISLEIFMVIVLRRIESGGVTDLGDNGIAPQAGLSQFRDDCLRIEALLGRLGKNHRPVLRADIAPLPVSRGWIVNRKKDSQQVCKGKHV